jgi:hypothetical protein
MIVVTTDQTAAPQNKRRLLPSLNVPAWRTIYLFFLVVLALSYWLFAWLMERIDLTTYQLPVEIPLPLPQFVVSFSSLFLPRVLRHFIPVILGWLIAYEMATNLLYYLYDLPSRKMARSNLGRLRNPGRSKGKAIQVTAQNLTQMRKESAQLRAGGPGRVQIPAGQVAVTERNGRFYRLLDAGTHALDSFEYIHNVLDLRPQQRNNPEVRLQSREGLEVCTHVSITFRISSGPNPASPRQPYPYDAAAVRRMAYAQINLGDDREASWEGIALAVVTSILSKIVFTFSLDELLQDSQTEIGTHLTISQQVEREARLGLAKQGIELIRVRIGRFRFPNDVTSQHIEYWSTYWDAQAAMAGTEGEAVALEELEIAKAEAEMDMIRAIVEGVHQAKQQGFQGTTDEVVALRLVDVLEKLARQSQEDISVPNQMLTQIKTLQQQLLLSGSMSKEIDQVPPPIINTNQETTS